MTPPVHRGWTADCVGSTQAVSVRAPKLSRLSTGGGQEFQRLPLGFQHSVQLSGGCSNYHARAHTRTESSLNLRTSGQSDEYLGCPCTIAVHPLWTGLDSRVPRSLPLAWPMPRASWTIRPVRGCPHPVHLSGPVRPIGFRLAESLSLRLGEVGALLPPGLALPCSEAP
jgi:hypothetical protein